jgi:hypothetical protein
MTDAGDVLSQARGVLDGIHTVPAAQVSRVAAILARQALEELIVQRLAELGAQVPGATMRSKLVCLRGLDDRGVAESATIAWDGLSRACHLHAYELPPMPEEVGYLIGLVETLLEPS